MMICFVFVLLICALFFDIKKIITINNYTTKLTICYQTVNK